MKSLTASFLARLMVVCAVAVAMASVGFAHRLAPVVFDQSLDAYLSAGGTLSDLCADADSTGHAGSETCDACRLADAAAIPPALMACTGHVAFAFGLALPAVTAIVPAGTHDPSRPVRAPPVA